MTNMKNTPQAGATGSRLHPLLRNIRSVRSFTLGLEVDLEGLFPRAALLGQSEPSCSTKSCPQMKQVISEQPLLVRDTGDVPFTRFKSILR